MLFLLRVAAVLLGTAIAAYTDAKTGLIPDKATYGMIALGVVFNLIEFDPNLFIVPVVVFAVGFALYWLGKIGGGDVKLFTGIAMLVPFLEGNVFVVHVLLAAALLSIVFYSTYYTVRYFRKGISFEENKQGIFKAGLLLVMMTAYLYYVYTAGFMGTVPAALFYIVVLFALVFISLEKGIKKNFFLKDVSIEKLEEDEVIAEEFLKDSLKEKLALKGKGILGEKEIAKLKEAGIKIIPVYRNMPPFAPFILLGCVAILSMPELFSFLLI